MLPTKLNGRQMKCINVKYRPHFKHFVKPILLRSEHDTTFTVLRYKDGKKLRILKKLWYIWHYLVFVEFMKKIAAAINMRIKLKNVKVKTQINSNGNNDEIFYQFNIV